MESSRPSERVRLAVPNKGRIAEPIMELLERSGLHVAGSGERRLIAKTLDPDVELLFARPIDIPAYVASGAADLGITGLDMVGERGAAVEDLLDLHFGEATLVLAVLEESAVNDPAQLAGLRIATEFPNLTSKFFARARSRGRARPGGRGLRARAPPRDRGRHRGPLELGHDPPDEPAPGRGRGPPVVHAPDRQPGRGQVEGARRSASS